MEDLLKQKVDFYREIVSGKNRDIFDSLNEENIHILPGFIENFDVVKEFYRTYYNHHKRERIVLCGINPGRLGAGKTGVPFLDYKSLSQLLPKVNNLDSEQSAQFIWQVISAIGPDKFFDKVYLTNISWFGFSKSGVNFNYYELSPKLQKVFTKGFVNEMAIIQPRIIIPLSIEVNKTLENMNLGYKIGKRLNHPNYCKFPARIAEGINSYVNAILGG